ncbi:TetR/AcrR family transcriptional repressor of nem operon [Rhizobium sp. BK650]|uniref:TetR/AcrR family transcriptional regulator n=1 Tax=Rhizobium sp. BK650 TaxID=2586990 RepID=UPI00160B48C0|nr:TetR/AcrR family transcriptional regulator [Rhizobium sp. BK650]MBB3658443.1 TetR/AcrR family transcriptional repressor of nem operon [Rhizobium sp. BK650]
MGHSQLEKQKTHDRIVEIASRRLRERGLEGIGVADLMKEAGLTVGGFYKHFASRDEMVAEAMKLAFGSWEAAVRSRGKEPADISIAEYSASYLSDVHRDDVSGGCPFAALTADLARSDEKCRSLATDQLKTNLENMTDRMSTADEAEARRKAIIVSCLMTGALGLARIADDEKLSDEILETARSFVNDFSAK